jgi:hypothetical protein
LVPSVTIWGRAARRATEIIGPRRRFGQRPFGISIDDLGWEWPLISP